MILVGSYKPGPLITGRFLYLEFFFDISNQLHSTIKNTRHRLNMTVYDTIWFTWTHGMRWVGRSIIVKTILPRTKTEYWKINAVNIQVWQAASEYESKKNRLFLIYFYHLIYDHSFVCISLSKVNPFHLNLKRQTYRIQAITLINWIFVIGFQFIKSNHMKYGEKYEKSVRN